MGRLTFALLVIPLSRFHAQPRKGHLERGKRIFGYLSSQPEGAIRFRTGEPDYSDLQDQDFDWTRTSYGAVKEHIPKDIPNPKGKRVITTIYVDASLHHDLTTGKSVTAVLQFVNSAPGDWFSNRQATVEAATYGSEFVAARTAMDQIIDLRYRLMYLGVPVHSRSDLFGDNSVVRSSTIPTSILAKQHPYLLSTMSI